MKIIQGLKGFYSNRSSTGEAESSREGEALLSAQLMHRKQQPNESVNEFAQDLEKLFERNYGRRKGMDESRKEMLKRDFLCKVCG